MRVSRAVDLWLGELARANRSDGTRESYRRYLVKEHRSYVPDFGVYIKVQGAKDVEYRSLSRQLVLFCVERRKAWRLLQSKAGIENREYKAQRSLLADVDAGKVSKDDLFANAEKLLKERMPQPAAHKPAPPAVPPARPAATAPVAAATPPPPAVPSGNGSAVTGK